MSSSSASASYFYFFSFFFSSAITSTQRLLLFLMRQTDNAGDQQLYKSNAWFGHETLQFFGFFFCCSFSFTFSSRWHRSARKGPYALRPVSQQSQGCLQNSASICLIEHRSFSVVEVGMSAASFLHSSCYVFLFVFLFFFLL